jgi:glutamin-(asparagin-)ase
LQINEHKRPKIAIAGTGGTIAGRGAPGNSASYDAGIIDIGSILEAVPGINDLADIHAIQVMNLPSMNMTDEKMIAIAKEIASLAASDVDGIVVTHGTDTIEETSYFANLTVKTEKPIVFTGAMRPSTSLSPDGPINLYDAVRVACNANASGKGVLLVMNGEIHTARDVTKRNTYRSDAFESPYGPLGLAVESQCLFYRIPSRLHTFASAFDISDIGNLPNVQIIYSYSSVSDVAIKAYIDAKVEGIVFAGTGNANVPLPVRSALRAAQEAGIRVARTSRTGTGSALRSPDAADSEYSWLVCDDQNPQKARLLLALALTRTRRVSELQKFFCDY